MEGKVIIIKKKNRPNYSRIESKKVSPAEKCRWRIKDGGNNRGERREEEEEEEW